MLSIAPMVFFVTLVDLSVLDITPNQNSRLTESYIVLLLLRPKTLISKSPVIDKFLFFWSFVVTIF